MRNKVLSIEIGSRLIKLVEAEIRGKVFKVIQSSILETPEGSIENGKIVNYTQLYKVLKEEFTDKKYKAKKTVAIINTGETIIRQVEMENYPDQVIEQLLEVKPESYLPIRSGEYTIDFRVLKQNENGKNEVLLVATPYTVVMPLVSLLKELRKKPLVITIPSEAIAQCFKNKRGIIAQELKRVLVIDLGAESIIMTIIEKGQALAINQLSFGIDMLFSKQQIGALEHQEVGSVVYQCNAQEFVRAQIERYLIEEIDIFLKQYEQKEEGEVQKIYLVGGGAYLQDIDQIIQESLHRPTEKLHTFYDHPALEIKTSISLFINALGAISKLKKEGL